MYTLYYIHYTIVTIVYGTIYWIINSTTLTNIALFTVISIIIINNRYCMNIYNYACYFTHT